MSMKRQIQELGQQGKKIRSIAKALGVSRGTVRRYLQEGVDTEVKKELTAHERRLEVLPWDEICKKRGLGYTVKKLHEDYAFEGLSYWAFNRYLQKKMPPSYKISTPMEYTPGRTVQVDYADGINIVCRKTGKVTKTQFFCGVLPFSSFTFGEFTENQKLDSFISSHENMFRYFGGVPEYCVHDNLKAGTIKAHLYDPDRNPTYVDFGNHYGFATLPARPYSPRDKATAEATIGAIQRSFFQDVRERVFYSLAELNEAFSGFLRAFNARPMQDYGVSRLERLSFEKDKLKPLPADLYERVIWKEAKVHPDCCVQIDKRLYSVPFQRIGQQVRVKVGSTELQIFSLDLEYITSHKIAKNMGDKSIYDEHYPEEKLALGRFEVQSAKRMAERIGPRMREYVDDQLSGSHPLKNLRRVQGVLALAKASSMTYEALEYAAGQSLTFRQPRLASIRNWATSYLVNSRKRSEKAPERSLDTVYLHSIGDDE